METRKSKTDAKMLHNRDTSNFFQTCLRSKIKQELQIQSAEFL